MTYEFLASLHDRAIAPVTRGRVYPAACELVAGGSLTTSLTLRPQTITVDDRLLDGGQGHLDSVRRRSPSVFDGPVVAVCRIVGNRLEAGRSSYFPVIATSDALRAEFEKTRSAQGLEDLPLRAIAHSAAGGDPWHSGEGRAAALGVSTLVTVPTAGGRSFLLGRRAAGIAADPEKWDVVPSGMLEPGPPVETVSAELDEELMLAPAQLAHRLRLLGWGFDLLRLRHEVCLRLDLDQADLPGRPLVPSAAEFDIVRLVELSSSGLRNFWRSHSPEDLTPSAAATIALLEAS